MRLGGNKIRNSMTTLVDYGIGYNLMKHLEIELTGGWNTYFYADNSAPAYSSYQTLFNAHFNF